MRVHEVAPHDYELLDATGAGEFHLRATTHAGFATCEVESQIHIHGTPLAFSH